ncbi:MAG: EamA family transporter [Burkholderiaceae bacterium]
MSYLTISQTLLVMVLWAVCFPLITVGIQYAPHLTFASLRAVLAGIILTGLALALRQPLPTDRKVWLMIAGVGLGATTLGFLGMFHAAEFISPGIATVIANTQPLLAAILAGVVLNERLNVRGKVGLALGFVGIVTITLPRFLAADQDSYLVGVAYITMAAAGITVSNVLIKRITGTVDALMAMGLQMLFGSIPLAIAAWAMEDPLTVRWTPPFITSLLILSVLGSAFVYWLWFNVLEKVQLNRANAFSFLVPVIGLTIGTLFYGERLGSMQLIGVVLTIAGVSLVVRRQALPPSSAGINPPHRIRMP